MSEEKWQRLYQSLSEHTRVLEGNIILYKTRIEILESEKKQLILDKLNQQQIIQGALDRVNFQNNEYLEENRKLREDIKRLRDGNNH